MYKTGDILHCEGQRVTSKLISRFTHSNITHTAMFIEVWGQPFVIEAQAKGVYIIPLKEWENKWKYKYSVYRSKDALNEKDFAVKAMSKLGHTAYDFESFLFRMPVKLITGNHKQKKNEDDKMFCSEFVAWCYGIVGAYRMTPIDLYNYCIEMNFEKIK